MINKCMVLATCLFYVSLAATISSAQPTSTAPASATKPPGAITLEPPQGTPSVKYSPTTDINRALRAFRVQPRAPIAPAEVIIQYRQLKPAELRALNQLFAKKQRTLAEWVGIVGPAFRTNEELLSAVASASVLADLSRLSNRDLAKARVAPGFPISGTDPEITVQIAELKRYPRLIGALKGTVSNATITPNKALIDVATLSVAPGNIVIPSASVLQICPDPLTDQIGESVGKCFDLKIRFGYPCWSWSKGWHTCHYTVNFGQLCFNAGCNVGYKITCCEATTWGTCYAQACLSGYCAGCSGGVTAGAGVTSTNLGGGMCSYGLNAFASIQCTVGGQTVFQQDLPLSPYSVQGPCPPGGFCP